MRIQSIQRYILCIAALSALMSAGGCKKDPVGAEEEVFAVSGQVADEAGQPVAGVGVHYMFDLKPLSQLPKGKHICPSTTISFQVPYAGHVSLKIYRWYTGELIATVVDTLLPAGSFRFLFNSGSLTNGVYVYRLLCDSVMTEHKMVLQILDFMELANTTPLVRSGQSGTFSLPYGQLGFNIPLQSTSPTGSVDTVYISPAITLVLAKPGYQTIAMPMTLDLSRETKRSFTLRK